MADLFDWNAIEGIRFKFKGNSPYDAQLNDLYSMIMDDIDMEDLFVENADAKVLAPFMMTNLRSSVAKSITYCFPRSTKLQKRHINKLLSGCSICYIASNGVSKTLRDPAVLEKAAKDALAHHTDDVYSSKPSITIKLIITSWRFTPTWKAQLFDKVYAIPIPFPSSCVGIPPVKPIESAVEPTIQVHAPPPDSDVNAIVPSPHAAVPSGTTYLVHTKTVDSNAVGTPVEALSGTPANFPRTFNPSLAETGFCPPKTSLQLPLPKANHAGIIHASASPTFEKHSAYPSHLYCTTYSNPDQTVFCITKRHRSVVFHRLPKPVSRMTKRHRDALKITLYHLHANILSMNWSYDNCG